MDENVTAEFFSALGDCVCSILFVGIIYVQRHVGNHIRVKTCDAIKALRHLHVAFLQFWTGATTRANDWITKHLLLFSAIIFREQQKHFLLFQADPGHIFWRV
ncbi:MAG: hypothetical protein C0469_11125 [Cyanobacteria bacterium DS2.3.42]|nr:hypothetical protein [Cyanobacteria bacterium DS2.3.42]